MKLHYIFLITAGFCMTACQEQGLDQKKSELEKYKQESQELNVKIKSLEQEIAQQDPAFAQEARRSTLVTTKPVEKRPFSHYLEVTGSLQSRQNIVLSAEAGGIVEKIVVREGDPVKKGQIVVRLDGETNQRSIEELETSLELANTVFERQSRLWEQGVGSEMQYLEAKNNKESLERRLASATSQLDKTVVRAPFSGTVESLLVREGESMMQGNPIMRIVSMNDMYIEADVSESFVGAFQKGDSVKVRFPSMTKTFTSTISAIGQVIKEENRTFRVEVRLPNEDFIVKPNLLAVLKIEDYRNENAVVIPTNLIQRDNQGDYIYIAKNGNNTATAEKVHITRGRTAENYTEVLEGLQGNEKLIDKGFREVASGMNIKESDLTL